MKAKELDVTGVLVETADESVSRSASLPFYGTGSRRLDGLLGGGFRAGTLTEVFGRSNSGKSQVAMQASLLAARTGAKALYIDTEGSFRPERLQQISRARGWEEEGVLQNVIYVRSDSVAEQMETIRGLEERTSTSSCGLVVVDTLTRNFSVELPGRSNMSSRQSALGIHLSEMARDSYINGRAYLLTNRVTFGQDRDVSLGGKTVEDLVHASVHLERVDGQVKATMKGDGRSTLMDIGENGIN